MLVCIASSRRIDIETTGISFVPLVPIRPSQHLGFASLGPFSVRPGRVGSVLAVVDPTVPYRVGGMFRRGEVRISTIYGPSTRQPPLTAAELRDLLQTYRTAQANPPDPTETDRRSERKERWVIGAATAVGIVVVGIVVSLLHN